MKYVVCEVTTILGEKYNKDLKIIEARTPEEAANIYKSTRPWIDKYHCPVTVRRYEYENC